MVVLNLELILSGDNNANFKIFLLVFLKVLEGDTLVSNGFDNFENYLIAILKVLDPKNKGFVSSDEIKEGFKQFNLYLSTQELISLTDYLKKDENGNYSMEDLYNLLVCYK